MQLGKQEVTETLRKEQLSQNSRYEVEWQRKRQPLLDVRTLIGCRIPASSALDSPFLLLQSVALAEWWAQQCCGHAGRS